MKITIIQPDIKWEDKKANLDHLEKLFPKAPHDTSLVILPEMFSTGFTMNSAKLAESWKSDTFQWMTKCSRQYGWAVCASYIVCENTSYYNRFLFVSAGDQIATYDKRHLFGIGGEDKNFSSGKERTIFKYRDFRINPIICYDLRFPVWLRNRNDYDLLVCVANWPESRRELWNILLRARAIENQCFVAGVNRIGKDEEGNTYAGDSIILNPKGQVIASLPEYEEGITSADISLSELQEFRKKFPVWKDADEFEIL